MSAAPTPFALGLDLGGTKIHAAMLDAGGKLRWEHRVPTPAGNYDATVTTLAELVRMANGFFDAPFTVGLGGPGALTEGGLIKNANSTCLNGRALVKDLQHAIGRPVRFANDANCLALSEAIDGAGADDEVVFAVILGTGTGAGIAVRRQVLVGPNRLAGEWGHNPLPWATPGEVPPESCYCGKRGCTEIFLSGPGMTADHVRNGGEPWSAEQIAQAATAGHKRSAATLERHASRLARALAGVINLLDPQVIVMGGGLSLMPHLYERVPRLWSRWVFSGDLPDPVRTRLVPARHGDASGVRGAAWLWRDG